MASVERAQPASASTNKIPFIARSYESSARFLTASATALSRSSRRVLRLPLTFVRHVYAAPGKMRPFVRLALLALCCTAGCADKSTAARQTPICPPDVDSSQVPCTSSDTHCYTLGGVYSYGANCIGCDPSHRHWETNLIGLICDGGTSD